MSSTLPRFGRIIGLQPPWRLGWVGNLFRISRLGIALRITGVLLIVAAACSLVLIVHQQSAIKRLDRYDTTWVVTQATLEVARLTAAVASLDLPDSTVTKDDVQLRLDILASQMQLLFSGKAGACVRGDRELQDFADQLQQAVHQLDALSQSADQPERWHKMLSVLLPLNVKVPRIASSAYASGNRLVTRDVEDLTRLYSIFAAILLGLIAYGAVLIVALGWHNR